MKRLYALALVTGCAGSVTAATPQDAFFANLNSLCGKTFSGKVATNDPADAAFVGKPLTMTVTCKPDEIRIPFAVGEDRSRTWVVTRSNAGLRLKHDHRHADGSEDAVSQYGGDTAATGSANRQEFPADAVSKEMFVRENRAVSVTNVWAMEVETGKAFAYELRRPGRHFRVEFDLTAPQRGG